MVDPAKQSFDSAFAVVRASPDARFAAMVAAVFAFSFGFAFGFVLGAREA